MHLPQRQRRELLQDRLAPPDRQGGGLRDPQARRAQRPCARAERRPRLRGLHRDLQLLRLQLLRAAHRDLFPRARRREIELRRPRGPRQVRRLRPVRGKLPGQRREARQQALHRRHDDPAPGRDRAQHAALGRQELQPRLPLQPHRRRRGRHRAVQGGMSRARVRAGLCGAREAGAVSRGAQAHQEAQPLPRHLRPHLQQALRERLHARRAGQRRRDRRSEEVHRRAGSECRAALDPADGKSARHPVRGAHRRDRRRPRGPQLRLLPAREGLPRDRL